MYLLFQLFQWVCSRWLRKTSRQVEKLHEIAFCLALKRDLLTNFKDQIKHDIKYTHVALHMFTCCIAKYFLREEFEKKLTMVNFLPVLCNGSIDKSVSEQEIAYVAFADPETRKPSFVFFEVIAPSKSQDFF